jgi:hypothetical protein
MKRWLRGYAGGRPVREIIGKSPPLSTSRRQPWTSQIQILNAYLAHFVLGDLVQPSHTDLPEPVPCCKPCEALALRYDAAKPATPRGG